MCNLKLRASVSKIKRENMQEHEYIIIMTQDLQKCVLV